MCKQQALLENVVFKYHPEFGRKSIRDFALRNPKAFNVEHLIEETIALYGGFEHSPSDGYDLISKKGKQLEVKAVSVNKLSYASMKVGAKTGDILAVIYNPLSEKGVHYFWFSNESALKAVSNSTLPDWRREMRIIWDSDKSLFKGKVVGIECTTLEELCILATQ